MAFHWPLTAPAGCHQRLRARIIDWPSHLTLQTAYFHPERADMAVRVRGYERNVTSCQTGVIRADGADGLMGLHKDAGYLSVVSPADANCGG